MKLIIQIPCWNEEKLIEKTIASISKDIEGVDEVKIVIIDDGSTDSTVEVAKRTNVDRIVKLPRHKGLASAFTHGVEAALEMDGDILVNTDADLQYPSEMIVDLIKPILNGSADIVIGNRLDSKPRPFGFIKMFFQRLGSFIVRLFSGTNVKDAASGFRAFSRDAMKTLVIHDEFSYTMESIFLAGVNKLRIENIPISINKVSRKSRLFKTLGQYIVRSAETIIRIFLMYHPLKFFISIGALFLTGAFLLGLRYLVFIMQGRDGGHIQSLILLVVFAVIGAQSIIIGLVADVVAANRRLLEEIRIKQMERKNE